jgi:hypothetical protein
MIFTSSNIFLNFLETKINHVDVFHPGSFDPLKLTGGLGHLNRCADQVGWVKDPARPSSLAPVTAATRGVAALGPERRRGKGSGRTRGSPGNRRGGRLGRRFTSDDEFGDGSFGLRQGIREAVRRTFSARRAAGGSAESAVLGGVHGAACRSLGGRARGGEKARERERKEGRGGCRGFEVRLQEVLLIARTSRRWRSGTSSPPRSCFL